MTDDEMKEWIKNASYQEMLEKWRFAPTGDPFFQGEIGKFYSTTMAAKRQEIGLDMASRISKRVGWDK